MRAPDALHLRLTTSPKSICFFRQLLAPALLLAIVAAVDLRAAVADVTPFYTGGDISLNTFISQQVANAGGQFTDNGVAQPLDQIMYDHGANLFRLRIFVNPQTTYTNTNVGAIQNTVYDIALAQQIKSHAPDAKIVLDFHMSDTWADPGHQTVPSAWSGQSLSTMESTVTTYTHDTLQSFYNAGVMPDIVQIGNETTSGILWNTGKLNFTGSQTAQNASWAAYGGLLNAGISGVRQIQSQFNLPRIPVALSIDKGDKDGQPQYHYRMLQNPVIVGGGGVGGGGVTDFDIQGVDFYSSSTTGITTMKNNLTSLAYTNITANTAPGNTLPLKRIMVLETNWPNQAGSNSYVGPWAKTPAGQEQEFLDVRNMLLSLPGGVGAGLLYWYPEAVQVPGYNIYNGGATALFDATSNHAALSTIVDSVNNPFAPIRGDFNGDGHFNATDISAMLAALSDLNAYKTARAFTAPDMTYLGDFNGDGVITNADLQGMIAALASGQGSTNPVPEPSAALLLTVAATAVSFRPFRRRFMAANRSSVN